MAAITTAVIGGVSAASSAASSMSAAKAQERQSNRANKQLKQAQTQAFGFSGADGMGGQYDPSTGQFNLALGDRLTGQQNQMDSFANFFGNRDASGSLDPARNIFNMQQGVAGNQPMQGDFSGLQGMIGNNLGLAQGGIGQAFGFQQGANAFGNRRFGQAENFFNEAAGGGSEGARSRTLDLLRQQSQPFEERAFSGLQDNQFATGRLGSSGGALQTEAFARGLGQADLSRQLAANQEGRNFQQNALGMAQGFQGAGTGARGLGDSLLSNAFSRFGGMSGLAQDVEGQRFGQAMSGQQNLFNQLGQNFTQQMGLTGAQRGFENQDINSIMQMFGAGNALQNIPANFLNQAAGFEQQRSNAALGSGSSMSQVQVGQGANANAALFSGLSGSAQNGGMGDFLNALGSMFGNKDASGGSAGNDVIAPNVRNPYGGSI